MIGDAALRLAFEETWPAAEYRDAGGFRVGRGLGAGGRVGSARPLDGWTPQGIEAAIRQHREWDQPPLFRAARDDLPLAEALRTRGLAPSRPTAVMQIAAGRLTDATPPPLTALRSWPPLAIQSRIWSEGGIDDARQAVMRRTTLPRSAILGRIRDRAGGAAFVAVAGDVAMLHALEIAQDARRLGLAQWLVREAGFFAAENGASRLALAVTLANRPAVALYEKLGFEQVGVYDYWS